MSPPVEKLLQDAITAHQQGNLKKADTLYRKLLSRSPRHAEATHMRGVLMFQQGKFDYATQLLADAQKLDKKNPWIRYHRGDLHRTTGEPDTAEKLFKEALELGAETGDVYFMLANTQFDQKNFSDALDNYRTAVDITPDDPDYRLNLANCYERLELLDKAVQQLEAAANVSRDKQSIELQLIELLARTGKFLEVSERVSNLSPSARVNITLLVQTISTLLEADRSEDASRLLDIIVTLDLSNESQETLALITGLTVNTGRYKDARNLLEVQNKRFTPDAIAWFQRGLCEQTSGDFESAANSHRRALKCNPTFGRAAYSLAINGKSDVTGAEADDWHNQAHSGSNSEEEKIQFLFAVARTLDARGDIEPAFKAYREANDLHHTRDPFDPDKWDAYIDSITEHFTASYFTKFESAATAGADLVFIVGMPRSGSTLLEYQLTRQFNAAALGEHPTARRLFMDLPRITEQKLPVAECAQHLTAEHIGYLQKQYLLSVKLHADDSEQSNQPVASALFTDKMLGNFLRLGMIAAMFPQAKILHCSRDAEATCVSCYTNLFARGLKFTYDLYGLGRAWRSYHRLMAHWHKVLPLSIYDVSYERLVTQPADVFAEISDFLGQPASSPIQESNTGAINTASFYQARQPISTKSLEGWKRFESYLDPLMRGLDK